MGPGVRRDDDEFLFAPKRKAPERIFIRPGVFVKALKLTPR
jgi:hypothetical protein